MYDTILAKSPFCIYRPGGVAGDLVVTTWAQVQDFIVLRQGAVVIYVDDSIVSPALVPGASGVTDCQGRVELRPFKVDPVLFTTLQVEPGATLLDLYKVTAMELRCNPQTPTPSLDFSSTNFGMLFVDEEGELSNAATAAQPAIHVPAGKTLIIDFKNAGFLNLNAPAVPLIDVPSTAILLLQAFDATQIAAGFASGAGNVDFGYDSSTANFFSPAGTPPPLPGLTGVYNPINFDNVWARSPLDPASFNAPVIGNVPSFDGTKWIAGSVPAGSVVGTPLTMAYFNALGALTGTPTFVTVDPANGFIFIGATTADHGSSARVQLSSIVANGSQFRSNQYGNNAGVPGLSTFKSRAAAIGGLAGLLAGDPIARITSVGVAPDNASIPIASFITIQVPAGFVPAGQNWLPSEFELQLVPLAGPINSRRPVFKVSSEGEAQTLRGVRAGGPSTLPTNFTTGTLWSSGAVNPNGTVIGSPGDIFSDTAGGAGATFWVKESGVNTNTGWAALAIFAETRIDFTASATDIFGPASTGIRRVRWQGCGGGGGGAGGGGGGLSPGNAGGEGGGGGGGAMLQMFETDIDLSHRIDVVIGAGGGPGAGGTPDIGAGAGPGGPGGDGGSTYVLDFTTNTILATFSGASGGAGGAGGTSGGPIVLSTAGGCTFSGAQTVNPNNGFPAAGGPGGPGGNLVAGGFPGNTGFFATGTAPPGTGLFPGGAGGTTGGTIEGGGGGGGGAGPYGSGATGGDGVDGPGTPGGDAVANSGAGAGGGGGGESAVVPASTLPGGPGGTGGSGRLTGFYFVS